MKKYPMLYVRDNDRSKILLGFDLNSTEAYIGKDSLQEILDGSENLVKTVEELCAAIAAMKEKGEK